MYFCSPSIKKHSPSIAQTNLWFLFLTFGLDLTSQFNRSDKHKWSQISHCAAFLFLHSKARKPRADRSTTLMLWYNKRYPMNSRDEQLQMCWPQHFCKCESSFSCDAALLASIIYFHKLSALVSHKLCIFFIINLISNRVTAYRKTCKSVNFHIWWDSKSEMSLLILLTHLRIMIKVIMLQLDLTAFYFLRLLIQFIIRGNNTFGMDVCMVSGMVWDFRTTPHTIPPYHTRFYSMPFRLSHNKLSRH